MAAATLRSLGPHAESSLGMHDIERVLRGAADAGVMVSADSLRYLLETIADSEVPVSTDEVLRKRLVAERVRRYQALLGLKP
jgi:hypothetical protein